MIRIISVVSNDIITDNRVHKIAGSLVNNGYSVTVVGRKFKHSAPLNDRVYHVRRFSLRFNQGPLFYASLNFRLFFYLVNKPSEVILANDMDTLPAAWLVSRLKKRKLVFDSHELFSEVPELQQRPFIQRIWRKLENFLIPRIDHGITVCESIAKYYKTRFDTDFLVIRNVGNFRYDHDFSEDLSEKYKNRIIYQGALNLGRGIELLIRSMNYVNSGKLWIVGAGDVEEKLKMLVYHTGLQEKVEFVGRLPLEELWDYTAQASLGVSLEEDMGLNYQYALPNKLFDYIQARIPVIVSDLPEMSKIVKKHGIGEVLKERTPENLGALIDSVIENSESYKINLELAARELCWEREEENLIRLFRDVKLAISEESV